MMECTANPDSADNRLYIRRPSKWAIALTAMKGNDRKGMGQVAFRFTRTQNYGMTGLPQYKFKLSAYVKN